MQSTFLDTSAAFALCSLSICILFGCAKTTASPHSDATSLVAPDAAIPTSPNSSCNICSLSPERLVNIIMFPKDESERSHAILAMYASGDTSTVLRYMPELFPHFKDHAASNSFFYVIGELDTQGIGLLESLYDRGFTAEITSGLDMVAASNTSLIPRLLAIANRAVLSPDTPTMLEGLTAYHYISSATEIDSIFSYTGIVARVNDTYLADDPEQKEFAAWIASRFHKENGFDSIRSDSYYITRQWNDRLRRGGTPGPPWNHYL